MLMKSYFFHDCTKPFVPLPTRQYYALESDNVSSVYGNNTVISSYNGISKGMGRCISDFNEEHLIYENGAGDIKAVFASTFSEKTLLSISAMQSIVIFDKSFAVLTFDAGTNNVTVSTYIISGAKNNPIAKLIGTNVLNIPFSSSLPHYFGSVKTTSSLAFTMQFLAVGAGQKLVKITKPDTYLDDITVETVDGQFLSSASIGFRGTISSCNNYFYYNNNQNYYAVINIVSQGAGYARANITIARSSDNTQVSRDNIDFDFNNTLKRPDVFVFIDNDTGNCRVLTQWDNPSTTRNFGLFEMQPGGTFTRLNSGSQAGTFETSNYQSVAPLFFDKYPSIRYYNSSGTVNRKATVNLGDANFVLANSVRTSNTMFGTSVKWA